MSENRLYSFRLKKHDKAAIIISCMHGVTALEFALIAPLLLLLLMGIIELGLLLFTYTVLEGATSTMSRFGKTNDEVVWPTGQTRDEYIRSQIYNLSGGYLDKNLLQIEIMSYTNFDKIGQPEPCITSKCKQPDAVAGIDYCDVNQNGKWDADQGAATADSPGAIVTYKVTYPWTFFTPLFARAFGGSSVFNITALATVKNEYFPGTAASITCPGT